MLVERRVLGKLLIEWNLAVFDSFQLLNPLSKLSNRTVNWINLLLLGLLGPHFVREVLSLLIHEHLNFSLRFLDKHINLFNAHLIKVLLSVATLSRAPGYP